jgi:hypothetical protein
VVLEHHGEVGELLAWLAPGEQRSAWQPDWEPVRAAAVSGRFIGTGGIALTLDLAIDPATPAARRQLLADDVRRYLGERWKDETVTVQPSAEGVTAEVLIADLPRRLEEKQLSGSAGWHDGEATASPSRGGGQGGASTSTASPTATRPGSTVVP